MQIRNSFHVVVVLVLATGLVSVNSHTSALAQQPVQDGRITQSELIDRISQADVGDLTAVDVVRLYELLPQIDSSGKPDVWGSTFDQVVWSWAVQRGLDADAAIDQLSRAYGREFGQFNSVLVGRLRAQLRDLPSPETGLYQAPSYIPMGLAHRVRRPRLVGRPPFGPIEKNGISRLSIGIGIPGLPVGP